MIDIKHKYINYNSPITFFIIFWTVKTIMNSCLIPHFLYIVSLNKICLYFADIKIEKETKPKFRRKFISLQQKIYILDQLNDGKKSTAIAKDLELNESTIRTIKQNESKIRTAVKSRSLENLSKSSRVKQSLIIKKNKVWWLG